MEGLRVDSARNAVDERRVVQRCRCCSAGLAQHTGPRASNTEALDAMSHTRAFTFWGYAHACCDSTDGGAFEGDMDPATRFALSVAAAP